MKLINFRIQETILYIFFPSVIVEQIYWNGIFWNGKHSVFQRLAGVIMKNQKRSVYLTVEQRLTIWIHIIMLSGRLWKFSAVVELVLIGLW